MCNVQVKHEGTSDRVVLLINFWHPELPPNDFTEIRPDSLG